MDIYPEHQDEIRVLEELAEAMERDIASLSNKLARIKGILETLKTGEIKDRQIITPQLDTGIHKALLSVSAIRALGTDQLHDATDPLATENASLDERPPVSENELSLSSPPTSEQLLKHPKGKFLRNSGLFIVPTETPPGCFITMYPKITTEFSHGVAHRFFNGIHEREQGQRTYEIAYNYHVEELAWSPTPIDSFQDDSVYTPQKLRKGVLSMTEEHKRYIELEYFVPPARSMEELLNVNLASWVIESGQLHRVYIPAPESNEEYTYWYVIYNPTLRFSSDVRWSSFESYYPDLSAEINPSDVEILRAGYIKLPKGEMPKRDGNGWFQPVHGLARVSPNHGSKYEQIFKDKLGTDDPVSFWIAKLHNANK